MENSQMKISALGPNNWLSYLKDKSDEYSEWAILDIESSIDEHSESLANEFIANWRGEIQESDLSKINDHETVAYFSFFKDLNAPLNMIENVLRVIQFLLENGSAAIKIEGSDMVYSLDLWEKFVQDGIEFQQAADWRSFFQLCSFAFVRRGIESSYCYETVGYHFVGLPEIFLFKESVDVAEILELTERFAEEIWQYGPDYAQEMHGAEWDEDFTYMEDDLRYNPFGVLFFPEIS